MGILAPDRGCAVRASMRPVPGPFAAPLDPASRPRLIISGASLPPTQVTTPQEKSAHIRVCGEAFLGWGTPMASVLATPELPAYGDVDFVGITDGNFLTRLGPPPPRRPPV